MKVITQVIRDKAKEAFHQAELDRSNITEYERDLYGFSGRKIKHTISNICSIKDNLNYLELGVYRGATIISASFRNTTSIFGVDDFTLDHKEAEPYKENGWNNPKIVAESLFERYKTRGDIKNTITLLQSEATKVDLKLINKKIDIIHYDLDEHHANLESVVKYYTPVLDKYSILLVSNWNSKGVRDSYNRLSTTAGLSLELIYEKLSSTTGDTLNWYNGFSASILTITPAAVAATKKEEVND